MSKSSKFPPNWGEKRVQAVLSHYESQTDEQAVAEDEAAFNAVDQVFIEVPNELVPVVRELVARHKAA